MVVFYKKSKMFELFYCFTLSNMIPCAFMHSFVAFSEKLQRPHLEKERNDMKFIGCVQTFDR